MKPCEVGKPDRKGKIDPDDIKTAKRQGNRKPPVERLDARIDAHLIVFGERIDLFPDADRQKKRREQQQKGEHRKIPDGGRSPELFERFPERGDPGLFDHRHQIPRRESDDRSDQKDQQKLRERLSVGFFHSGKIFLPKLFFIRQTIFLIDFFHTDSSVSSSRVKISSTCTPHIFASLSARVTDGE